MKGCLTSISIISFLTLTSVNAYAYNSKDNANGAMMISASCMWWQAGKISKGQIMSFAKEQYSKRYGNPSKVDWNSAIYIAKEVDKRKGLGCLK